MHLHLGRIDRQALIAPHDWFQRPLIQLVALIVDARPVKSRTFGITGTGDKGRNVHAGRMRHETALASDRDGGPDVVARDHATGKVCSAERVDVGSGIGFEFVFEYDKAEELKIGFGLFTVDEPLLPALYAAVRSRQQG